MSLAARIHAHRYPLAGIAVALAVVVAGKQFYRDATAAELGWILAPTAQLVSWLTGGNFVYEAGPGWIDIQIGFIIAPPCAGMNFALAAFLALSIGGAVGMTSVRTIALRLAAAIALAYVATLVVNTIRIVIAVEMHRGTIDIGTWDRAELHRIEGIVVYLGGLVGLYALARALDRLGDRRAGAGRLRGLYWLAVPLAAYVLITLVFPAANGAARRPEFALHAMWVLGACAAMAGMIALTQTLRRRS